MSEYTERLNQAIRDIRESGHEVHFEPQHFVSGGVYVRVLSIPAGYAMIGKTHKQDHVFAIIEGNLAVSVEGEETQVYGAPYFMESKAGVQRSVFAINDCIAMTSHAVEENQTIEEIEDFLVYDQSLVEIEQDKVVGIE